MKLRRIVLLLALVVVLVGAGLGFRIILRPSDSRVVDSLGSLVSPGDAEGFNVALITLDTVRRDRLGCYGYTQAETPACDGLLASGVLFADAVTSVPLTLPSHATVLTGLDPPRHGVRDNGSYRLAPSQLSLAETLNERGYRTAAFVGSFVLDARFGLSQGFDRYDFEVTAQGYRPTMPDFNERGADAVSDAAIAWLEDLPQDEGSDPFFLWVHYFDPHQPYRSPLGRLPRFAARPYDAEIAFVDIHLGRLLASIERLGIRDRTLIILVSDHGEALGEHGEPTHGMLLYEAAVRVPMILSCPGLFRGSYVVDHQVVGLVDLRPTIEDLLGIDSTMPSDGQSLLRATPEPERAIYLETHMPMSLAGWSPLYGLRRHSSKFILAPEPEFYDLAADPDERENRYSLKTADLAALENRLQRSMALWRALPDAARPVTDDEASRLAALGYAVSPEPSTTGGPRPDPKHMMPVYNKALQAEALYARHQYHEAAELAREVLETSGESVQALRTLAFSYLRLGRGDEAVSLLRGAVDRGATTFIIRSLVQVLILELRYEEAETVLDLYESVDPADGRVAVLRGDILDRLDRPREAVLQYRRAIDLDEHRSGPMARQRIERLRQRSPLADNPQE